MSCCFEFRVFRDHSRPITTQVRSGEFGNEFRIERLWVKQNQVTSCARCRWLQNLETYWDDTFARANIIKTVLYLHSHVTADLLSGRHVLLDPDWLGSVVIAAGTVE